MIQATSNIDVDAVNAALALLSTLTAKDLEAVHRAHKLHQQAVKRNYPTPVPAPTVTTTLQRRQGDTQERRRRATDFPSPEVAKRERKNEKQRAQRATPEGRTYANEAAKKSYELLRQRTEAVKALMAEKVVATTTKKP